MSLYLSPRAARVVRFFARDMSLVACAVFATLAIQRGPPASPDGPGLERDAQYIAVLIAIIATGLAWRWPGFGGAVLSLVGVMLGVMAASRYSTETALFAALMFVVPGVLFLLLWGSGRALLVQAALVAFVVAILVLGGREAQTRHDLAFGPAHPQSQLQALPTDRVEWMWAGATTATSFDVRARVKDASLNVRLAVDTEPGLTEPVYSDAVEAPADANRVAALHIGGLKPSTIYYYAVEVDGVLDQYQRGEVRTFPQDASSFTLAFSSCARTGSNGAVFDAIRKSNPLLYIVTGDIHYENIDANDRGRFRDAYNTVLTTPSQSALYRSTSVAYVWDDHDYGGNNSDASSRGRAAARLTYRENVPHYAMVAGDGNDAIYQALTIGRVRIVMTDTRSEKNAESFPGGGRSMLGIDQRDWLKDELLEASRSHSLVIWVNSDPWISSDSAGGDDWSGFASERKDIADFIARNGIRNLVMLSGDAHMIAADDGSNSDYSSSRRGGFPVFHAASLDRPGSVKGGPYSEGTFPGAGQFGLLDIEDDGKGRVSVTFRGMDYTGSELLRFTFAVPVPAALVP